MTKDKKVRKENIKIFVSMHKESYVPDNSLLVPIQVGTALCDTRFSNMLHDDEGDNISEKNRRYCELTAQYYAWKNVKDADYYGFWHYRRYFCFNAELKPDMWGNVNIDKIDEDSIVNLGLDEVSIRKTISGYDIVIPYDWECNEGDGVITVNDHWTRHFPVDDLKLLIQIVGEIKPEYLSSLMNVLYGTSAPFCNLFIMKKECFLEYNQFCFDVLEEFEKRCDHSRYNVEQYRLLGHLAERLMATYINHKEKNSNIRILRVPTVLIRDTTPIAKIFPINDSNKKIVSLCLACDNFFVPYTSVLLQSIKENSSIGYYYDIVIMHRNISDTNQNILKCMFEKDENISLRFANVSRNFEKYKDVYISRHLSVETYYRFLIFDVFEGYHRILYMDCDMIVNKDVAELFFTNIGDNYIGAVRDLDFVAASVQDKTRSLYENEILKYIKIKDSSQYFQAGVILFDLDKMRGEYSTEQLFKVALSREWYYHDQDVLNHLLNGKVFYLDVKWNVYTLLEKNSDREKLLYRVLQAHYVDEYNEARKDIGIIHFAGTPKPWNDSGCDLAVYFWKYARKSPFYEELFKELNSDILLPFGSIEFNVDDRFEDNKGIEFLKICLSTDLWYKAHIKIDLMYLPDHYNLKYCFSTLYIAYSVHESNGNKVLSINNFIFSEGDNSYYLKDNIGYKVTEQGEIILYGRNVRIYEGFTWRVTEIHSNNNIKPRIKTLITGVVNQTTSLNDVIFNRNSYKKEGGYTNDSNNSEIIVKRNGYEENKVKELQYRIDEIEKSFTYRLAMKFTAIPRKLRRKRNL